MAITIDQQLLAEPTSNVNALNESKSLDEKLLDILAIDPDRYFEEVCTLFVQPVLTFLLSRIKEPKYMSEIDDFVQQTFANFWSRLQNLNEKPFGEMNHLAYLRQIAWNVFLKRVKYDQVNMLSIGGEDISIAASTKDMEDSSGYELACPEWGFSYIELMADIKEKLNSFSNKECRGVLALHLFNDLSNQEIARKLGIPLGTVKSHLSRGKKILRMYLEESRNCRK